MGNVGEVRQVAQTKLKLLSGWSFNFMGPRIFVSQGHLSVVLLNGNHQLISLTWSVPKEYSGKHVDNTRNVFFMVFTITNITVEIKILILSFRYN